MKRSKDEQFLHDWVIRKIEEKYARTFSEVHINPGDEKNFEYQGLYPDAVFVNYGQTVQIVEVETKETVTEENLPKWTAMSEAGVKLSLLVPKEQQKHARDLCWKAGLVAKVNLGSFDVEIKL